ncbi:MAG TPA: TIGR01777 family oxidoreductase [Actinomycetes bacterium]|nr:TIGR01777 family oxidoreductase [Actinomycetes bacterium]
MRIAVTGSTGLIGTVLVSRLAADGHQVIRFTRSPSPAQGDAHWDPAGGTVDAGALARADAVVHLAGRSIGALRWTAKVRREILDSRVDGTRLLAETMAGLEAGPRVLVCASGVNWYGDRGDEVLTERSPGGQGFLAEVCQQWEAAAEPARAAGARTVHVRTGVVQAREGGALPIQARLFRLGLGGRLGSGRQWWSWIALDDLVGIYIHALTSQVQGPLNGTTPNPVTNAEFTAVLARVLGRPALLPVPALGPRLLLGQMADELLFNSTRAYPAATQASGYAFRHPDLEPALRHVLGRR